MEKPEDFTRAGYSTSNDGLILLRGRAYVPKDEELRKELLKEMSHSHSSGRSGSGVRSRGRGIGSSRSPSVHRDQMQKEGEEPSALRLLQETHRRADGKDQLSPSEINSLYLEVVQPDAKGRIYGVGAMATQLGGGHPDATSIGHHVSLTKEVELLKKKIQEFEDDRRKIARLEEAEARIARYETLFARLFPPRDDPPTAQDMPFNPFLTPQPGVGPSTTPADQTTGSDNRDNFFV
ncbi:PREDICTED: uncharacterized protein LOC104804938 [Tarenaya hassleriana]|uniref:uncharacterized protein LOC104804938 n=1 Tax=Tarenaya hassleriana TaxID=28532 RepID=UPI0008FD2BCC|nr:PREDICTED: uncharacterized protein LOC104804938 [Tarenaya hassleriana]